MGDKTGIEWTDATWNPVVGCSVVSPGCTNCYAMRMADRLAAMTPRPDGIGNPHLLHYAGTTTRDPTGRGYGWSAPVWTGKVALAPEHILTAPLRWRRPRKIFVNSMGDLFHDSVPDAWIDRVFAVMALAPQHTFQVLTKRSARMRSYFVNLTDDRQEEAQDALSLTDAQAADLVKVARPMPLRNVWLGVSAEDQRRANERVPDLLAIPAAVRFVSAEPLLGPIDFTPYLHDSNCIEFVGSECVCSEPREVHLDWIIVGGESGPGARPMHPQWARDIRDQCSAAGVTFHFKQWGEWLSTGDWYTSHSVSLPLRAWTGDKWTDDGAFAGDWLAKIGKARAGRLLDGVQHDGMPEVRS